MSVDSGTTDNGVQADVTAESTVEDILKRWEVDEGTPSTDVEEKPEVQGKAPEGNPEEDDLVLEDEGTEVDPATTPDATTPEKRTASDDDEVVIKVDGEDKRASVKDLTRLYGQEASLTRKGQELSNQRKLADDQAQVALGVLTKMYEKAVERAKPYEDIDLFKASRELEPEEFDALRKEIARATEDKKFFETELGGYTDSLRNARAEYIRNQSGNAIATLKAKIPTWSDALYDEIRTYAVGEGMHPDIVNQIVDPNSLLMIHKARLYDAAKARAKTKTTPVQSRVPTKVVKPAAAPVSRQAGDPKGAMSKFRQSGRHEDAVEALMAKWASED